MLLLLATTMPTTAMIQPDYAGHFQCIGSACEDTCCAHWNVYFDEATCRKYEGLEEGPLKALIQIKVVPEPLNSDGSAGKHFAKLNMQEDGFCPFLSAEKLCAIQGELGSEYLSVTCATYPRIAHRIDGLAERSLSLSCPEAARLVLLTPELLALGAERKYMFQWEDVEPTDGVTPRAVTMIGYFWPIRAFVLALLSDRAYALWQRVFLVGVFTRRLEALARGELGSGFLVLMQDFGQAVDSGLLRESMEAMPADLALQLDLVLRLAGLRLPRVQVTPRFIQLLEVFAQGIGNGPGATMESLIGQYKEAHDRYFEPFFRARPHILENLLVNTVFRTLFPFAHRPGEAEAVPEMGREFALLATQFALMKGLLIGVAGFYGEAFAEEHVVWAVQATSKHFEHHPRFLGETHALLVASGLDNMRGLTMLIRN